MEMILENDGKVDEMWLDAVLRENSERMAENKPLTPEFGAVCIRFTDAVMCDAKLNFRKLDKLMKAEVCSKVYLHICKRAGMYRTSPDSKPSNWLITVVKNRMIQAVGEILRSEKISDIVSAVVGSETLAKMSGIDRNSSANRILSERVAALADFQLDRKTKESIFGQVWRNSWFRRDNLTVAERSRKHGRAHAVRVASQSSVSESGRKELLKILEERKNGRT